MCKPFLSFWLEKVNSEGRHCLSVLKKFKTISNSKKKNPLPKKATDLLLSLIQLDDLGIASSYRPSHRPLRSSDQYLQAPCSQVR